MLKCGRPEGRPEGSTVLVALLAGLYVLLVAAATLAAGARARLLAVVVLVALLARFDMLLVRGVVTAAISGIAGIGHVEFLMRTCRMKCGPPCALVATASILGPGGCTPRRLRMKVSDI